MPPNMPSADNKIVHPSGSATGGGVTVVGSGQSLKGAKPHHELILGFVAVASGFLLPFLGVILGGITIAKGIRQSRTALIGLGAAAIVASAVGAYIYVTVYSNTQTKKATTRTPSSQNLNAEERNPDGFDAVGSEPQ